MAVKTRTASSSMPTRRVLMIGILLILALGVIVAAGWLQADYVIAPPPLRLMNWLWGIFI